MIEILKDGEVIDRIRSGSRFKVPDEQRVVFNVTLETDLGEGYTIREYVPPPPPDPVPPTEDELDEMAAYAAREDVIRLTALTIALDNTRPETERQRVVMVFPRWKVGEEVIIGDKRRHDGTLYECIQGHTTQADWEPQDTPALWNSLWEGAPGEVEPWTQPQGAHDAYQIGAKVTHNGKTWTNTVADNVWEPGVHGWVEDA